MYCAVLYFDLLKPAPCGFAYAGASRVRTSAGLLYFREIRRSDGFCGLYSVTYNSLGFRRTKTKNIAINLINTIILYKQNKINTVYVSNTAIHVFVSNTAIHVFVYQTQLSMYQAQLSMSLYQTQLSMSLCIKHNYPLEDYVLDRSWETMCWIGPVKLCVGSVLGNYVLDRSWETICWIGPGKLYVFV